MTPSPHSSANRPCGSKPDEAVDTLPPEDRMDLRAMHRELADRPVEIDVGNPPAALILAQKVVEPRHIALRFDEPSFHYNICAERPFTGDLQLLARISVELIGVGGGHIMTKGRDQLLLLGGGKARPGGANREAAHCRDVEAPVNDWRPPGKTPAFAEYAAFPHIAEQNSVEASDHVLGVRSRGRWLSKRGSDEQQRKANLRKPGHQATASGPQTHISAS